LSFSLLAAMSHITKDGTPGLGRYFSSSILVFFCMHEIDAVGKTECSACVKSKTIWFFPFFWVAKQLVTGAIVCS